MTPGACGRLLCVTLTANVRSLSLFVFVSLAPSPESSRTCFSPEQQPDWSVQLRRRSAHVLPCSHDQASGPVPGPDSAVGS